VAKNLKIVAERNRLKMDNLIGKRFGKLIVLEKTNKKYQYNNYYLCKCDCGNLKIVLDKLLKSGHTKSCGCLHKEIASKSGKKSIKDNSKNRIEIDKRYNTNFGVITTDKPPKNNKSGIKGVWYNPKRDKWEAHIGINNKRINLGRYNSKEEAIKIRKNAEKEYYEPLIKKMEIENNRKY